MREKFFILVLAFIFFSASSHAEESEIAVDARVPAVHQKEEEKKENENSISFETPKKSVQQNQEREETQKEDQNVLRPRQKQILQNEPKEEQPLQAEKPKQETPFRPSIPETSAPKEEENKEENKKEDKQALPKYDLLPKTEKDEEIPLPEISESEVGEFENITPSQEKKERSYLVRGIISIFLVIAGFSMLSIVVSNEIKRRNSVKKKEFKNKKK
ncbi:MAG: hypothetical protein LBK29_00245 [Oscillospiraceae bacterium]|nr:hypothetical protein [Oscillospiraceae bacterium]